MLYIILEKEYSTDQVSVHSVWENEEDAMDKMEQLIEYGSEDYGYRMDAIKSC